MKFWTWWKERRWWFRWISYAIVLIASFYTVENIRGHRALEKAKAEYLAAGYRLDVDEILGPPIPDEENFAAAEVLYEEIEGLPSLNHERYRASVEKHGTHFLGIDSLPLYFEERISPKAAAKRLESTLKSHEKSISSLREAVERKETRWERDSFVSGKTQTTPSMTVFELLNLLALCRIAEGNSKKALEAIVTQQRMSQELMKRSNLVSFAIGSAYTSSSISLIKESMRQQIFEKSALVELKSTLQSSNREHWLDECIELQVAGFVRDLTTKPSNREVYSNLQPWTVNPIRFPQIHSPVDLEPFEDFVNRLVWRIMPNGWHDKAIALFLDTARLGKIPKSSGFDQFLVENLSAPAVVANLKNSYHGSDFNLTLCKLAIALEIHSLDHGSYPSPKSFPLPSGNFGYQLGANGRPVLWYSPDAPVSEPLTPEDFETIDQQYLWRYR